MSAAKRLAVASSLVLGLAGFSLSAAAQATDSSKPLVIAAPKRLSLDLLPGMAGARATGASAASLATGDVSVVRGAAGASFIKVHFEYFRLPEGAYVEVSDAAGKEVYRYGADGSGTRTVDTTQGEDGKTRFGAMSITGDTAHVRLVLNGAAWDARIHGVRVRQIMEGFPQPKIDAALASDRVTINATYGNVDRADVQCFAKSNPAQVERSRPVALLVLNGGVCTTWRVGAGNHMFTNNHCIATQAATAAAEVWFNYQRSECGAGDKGPVTKLVPGDMLATNYELDYTLFTLKDFKAAQSFGHMGLEVRQPEMDEQIYIAQHPKGEPKQLAINSDKDKDNLCRIQRPVMSGRGRETDTGYRCDTEPGSSGSPVLAYGSNKVIALHHLGGNSGVLMSRIWPEVAPFFGGKVPFGDDGSRDEMPPVPVTPTPVPVVALKLNSPIKISGEKGSEHRFVLTVADAAKLKTLRFSLSGGEGDADLYVRLGDKPNTLMSDCKAVRPGNNDSCVSAPKAGEYHVLVRGNAAFKDVELRVHDEAPVDRAPVRLVFTSTTDVAIPDANKQGASSALQVSRSGAAGQVKITVDIRHTYIGDLLVELVAPSGKALPLHNRAGGSKDNLAKTYKVNAGELASEGSWKLRATDFVRRDVGYINAWKLEFAKQ